MSRHEARQKGKRLTATWADMARRAVDLQERLVEQLQQPKECAACHGSGECMKSAAQRISWSSEPRCGGEGSLTLTYLTPSVRGQDDVFRGRCIYGCPACGGLRTVGEP